VTSHVIRARAPRGAASQLERVTDAGRLAHHLADAAHVPGGKAEALVVPRNEREVAEALTTSTTVLVIGAQSSLTGGATPRGDTLLSTARLRTIEDPGEQRLRVGAGVTIAEVDERLRRRGALYPPVPTWQGATVGGTIATNAAGAATFKHGTTRAWVEGLTVVLATGDVLDLRRGEVVARADGYFEAVLQTRVVRVPVPRYTMPAVAKLSAGYFASPGMDLIDLFIGAEGTLGVITEATLRVQPARPAVCLAFVTSRDRSSAIELVTQLRREALRTWRTNDGSGLDVSAIEYMDARSLSLLREDGVDRRLGLALDDRAAIGLLISIDLPPSTSAGDAYRAFGSFEGGTDANALPVGEPGVEVSSGDARSNATALAQLAALLQQFGVAETTLIAVPGETGAAERLLALREAVPLAVNQRVRRAQREIDSRIEKTAADVIVPFPQIEAMLELYDEELRRRGLDAAIWGHLSDGNVHPNIIPRSYADVESGRAAVIAFGREAIRLGGAPLAEHGVGRNVTKQQLVRELYGDEGVAQMQQVKCALDPDWKLAPGVIFTRT